jgi:DNA-binding LacI/PurR family transcriptional regulator
MISKTRPRRIADIARQAEVSIVTVRRVLAGKLTNTIFRIFSPETLYGTSR